LGVIVLVVVSNVNKTNSMVLCDSSAGVVIDVEPQAICNSGFTTGYERNPLFFFLGAPRNKRTDQIDHSNRAKIQPDVATYGLVPLSMQNSTFSITFHQKNWFPGARYTCIFDRTGLTDLFTSLFSILGSAYGFYELLKGIASKLHELKRKIATGQRKKVDPRTTPIERRPLINDDDERKEGSGEEGDDGNTV
jgi:hypothetical protein